MSQNLCNVQDVSIIVFPNTSALWYIVPPQGHAVLAGMLMVSFKRKLFVYMRSEALLR